MPPPNHPVPDGLAPNIDSAPPELALSPMILLGLVAVGPKRPPAASPAKILPELCRWALNRLAAVPVLMLTMALPALGAVDPKRPLAVPALAPLSLGAVDPKRPLAALALALDAVDPKRPLAVPVLSTALLKMGDACTLMLPTALLENPRVGVISSMLTLSASEPLPSLSLMALMSRSSFSRASSDALLASIARSVIVLIEMAAPASPHRLRRNSRPSTVIDPEPSIIVTCAGSAKSILAKH